jgi:outer membrane receptor for ferrienterochelin and colicins
VVIKEKLKPERSYNVNLNYVKKIYTGSYWLNVDASVWYTYFTNRILPDYTTNVNQIIYDNLKGFSESKGVSVNTEFGVTNSLRGHLGITLQDVTITQKDSTGKKQQNRQLLTERFSGTWSVSYTIRNTGITIDYTGNIYGPMLLPLLGDLDPRRPESPVWSIQNIQVTKKFKDKIEIYAGIKNLLNWTPARNASFLIARSDDPFDKRVEFDNTGKVVPTPDNPYGLTFDPNYVYAPNQGLRGFVGLRYNLQ